MCDLITVPTGIHSTVSLVCVVLQSMTAMLHLTVLLTLMGLSMACCLTQLHTTACSILETVLLLCVLLQPLLEVVFNAAFRVVHCTLVSKVSSCQIGTSQ